MIRTVLKTLATRDIETRAPFDISNKMIASGAALVTTLNDAFILWLGDVLAEAGLSITDPELFQGWLAALAFAVFGWVTPEFKKRENSQ